MGKSQIPPKNKSAKEIQRYMAAGRTTMAKSFPKDIRMKWFPGTLTLPPHGTIKNCKGILAYRRGSLHRRLEVEPKTTKLNPATRLSDHIMECRVIWHEM